MSIMPKGGNDAGAGIIGDAVEAAYQVDRARQGKPYKPMGQEEVVEPVGRWVGRVTGSRTGRVRE
jgi:hypothetical protein